MGRHAKTQQIIDMTVAYLVQQMDDREACGYPRVMAEHIDIVYHQLTRQGKIEKSRSSWRAFVKAINDAIAEGTIPREWIKPKMNYTPRPSGTSRNRAVRILHDYGRKDLTDRVIAGELSWHGAVVEAGFRPRTITINADDPVTASTTMLCQCDHEFIKDLIKELSAQICV